MKCSVLIGGGKESSCRQFSSIAIVASNVLFMAFRTAKHIWQELQAVRGMKSFRLVGTGVPFTWRTLVDVRVMETLFSPVFSELSLMLSLHDCNLDSSTCHTKGREGNIKQTTNTCTALGKRLGLQAVKSQRKYFLNTRTEMKHYVTNN